MQDVARNLESVKKRIAAAACAAGCEADSVTLVAVSKGHPAEAVAEAIAAGQRVFGENRVQEAKAKFAGAGGLRAAHPGLELHLIGPLQTNKIGEALRLFDVIESLDRAKLARALASEMRRLDHRLIRQDGHPRLFLSQDVDGRDKPGHDDVVKMDNERASGGQKGAEDPVPRAPRFYIEVNSGNEPQKSGVAPGELGAFLKLCREECGLAVEGLMCIPPQGEDPAPHFRRLADLARAHGLAKLSMGMSGDFESAIACGATSVRVGTAIFGGR
ncbi:MAG TPA: YggS family pyridoxal phosphate enzyme [Alphaproteobacteria bacterium]|nr:YggS family pyridoxal phosphate enzyme [Alphaproteobacteria bacterium]